MTYSGVFIRQALGQKPSDQSQGSCNCPDIIFNGVGQSDPSTFVTPTSYSTWMSPADVTLQNDNYVYLRGLQTGTTGSNLFFYYVPCNLAMWPQDWLSDRVRTSLDQSAPNCNWVYTPPSGTSQPVVTPKPLIWTPPLLDPNVPHYCAIVWADNQPAETPAPPPFSTWGNIGSFDQLMLLLAQHPNMGWRNTIDHPAPPPDLTYRTTIATATQPQMVNIFVSFNNIADGTFTVNLVGDVTFSTGTTPLNVSNYQGGYSIRNLPFAANQKSVLQVTHAGSASLSLLASITAQVEHIVHPQMMEQLVATPAYQARTLPIKKVQMERVPGNVAYEDVFIIGSQTWNLKFKSDAL